VAVVSPGSELAGVVAEWDLARATVHGSPYD
jgi:hypothetical protein